MESGRHPANRQSISLLDIAPVRPSETLPFVVQPLMLTKTADVFGYEVLYRGPKPLSWTSVDERMLRFLSNFKMGVTLFVNLSNDTVLTIDENLLFAAHENNDIFFEWSEVIADEMKFREVTARINSLTKKGLRFVIDDFGAGRDGFERLFAVEHVSGIKFDGTFFRTASINAMAHSLISNLIAECRKKAILTVGEWIESASDYRLAQSLGLDMVQGFYCDDVYSSSLVAMQA